MASGEFDAKRRKINDLRFSVPLCSQGALGAIRKQIANHGLPENHKRFAMWKETKEFLEDASMSKKQKPITWQGAAQTVLYINFLSLLAGVFSKGGAFTDIFLQFHASRPSRYCQPWTAVAYADEVHPGHMLNSSSRETWCLYMSFLEYGKLLSRSDMWFCLCTIRSTEVSLLQAGFSNVFSFLEMGFQALVCCSNPKKDPSGCTSLWGCCFRQRTQNCVGKPTGHRIQTMFLMQNHFPAKGRRKLRRTT